MSAVCPECRHLQRRVEDSVFRFYSMAQYTVGQLRESLRERREDSLSILDEMDSDLDEGLKEIMQSSGDLRKHRREAHR